jgi:hypothetical protein
LNTGDAKKKIIEDLKKENAKLEDEVDWLKA